MNLNKKYSNGGLVPVTQNGEIKTIKLDRGWWKCKKCGAIFEAYTNPPITGHVCNNNPDVQADGCAMHDHKE